MSHAVDNNTMVDDKIIMRRLGMAVMAMCVGAIGIVILAITVGHFH